MMDVDIEAKRAEKTQKKFVLARTAKQLTFAKNATKSISITKRCVM